MAGLVLACQIVWFQSLPDIRISKPTRHCGSTACQTLGFQNLPDIVVPESAKHCDFKACQILQFQNLFCEFYYVAPLLLLVVETFGKGGKKIMPYLIILQL
ncbi:hypothetical protein CHS0354_040904 [Potamilus streckersoni]|uniref:Uncharacterized protein n=1 Tax=Potamilus streckersoni TaxID=2493646 RepID=A0AAE0VXE5_9BIVA|nr:hypothetical protein CHS0354_040904 [Potamilus streckersoni]